MVDILKNSLIDFYLSSKKGVPVAFCLMPNRKASTYMELFQRLKQEAVVMGKLFEPSRIVSDFESALIPTARQEVIFLSFSEASQGLVFPALVLVS